MIWTIIYIVVGAGVGYWFGRRKQPKPEHPALRISKETDPPLSVPVKMCISKGGIPIINKDGVMEDCVFPPYDGPGRKAK